MIESITYLIRCDAHPSNLDAGGVIRGITERWTFSLALGILALCGMVWDLSQHCCKSHFLLQVSNLYLQLFTHEFPCADIHELLSADLVHQIIKVTFKDHIVMWVNEYLMEEHGKAAVLAIIADIDCW